MRSALSRVSLLGTLFSVSCGPTAAEQAEQYSQRQQQLFCDASCCTTDSGCHLEDPYEGESNCAEGAQHVADGPIIDDRTGVSVGQVSLLWSEKCQAWWTETRRYLLSDEWYATPWEMGASFEGERRNFQCLDGVAEGHIENHGLTVYGCMVTFDFFYNNTFAHRRDNNVLPRACGWLALKPDEGDGEPVYFENCGLSRECDSNRAPDCQHAYPSVDIVYAEGHDEVEICVEGISDLDNNHYVKNDGARVNMSIELPTSNQADDAQTGDGTTTPDTWEQAAERNCVSIRAERRGDVRDARTYEINFNVTDQCDASCTGTVQVNVPHDRRDN